MSSLGLLVEPFTIIRTRGFLGYGSDQSAATEFMIGAYGVGIVTETARAAGVASVPGPLSNPLWDGWFVYGTFGSEVKFGTNVGVEPQWYSRQEIDSKAMRKLDGDDEDVVLVVENDHATNAFDILFNLRFLAKRS